MRAGASDGSVRWTLPELAAAVVAAGASVAILAALTAAVEARAGLVTALLAAAVALLVTQPLRVAAQRALAGLLAPSRERDLAVAARLRGRLDDIAGAEELPGAVADVLFGVLELSFVAVELRASDGVDRVAARGGEPSGSTTVLPVRSGDAVVGQVLVAGRGRPPPERDLAVARELVRQAGPALDAARLARELSAERAGFAAARAAERLRLSAEVHDRVGPALAGLRMSVEARLAGEPRIRTDVSGAQLAEQAAETGVEVRHVLAGLGPAAVAGHGLREAIELLAGRLAPDGRPAITVRSSTDLGRLAPELEATAYAIAVEALSNVARHARAATCAVELSAGRELRLVVLDDGAGLPPRPAEGLGLASMHRRAHDVGGRLLVTRPPGGGTRIEAVLPVGRPDPPGAPGSKLPG